MWELISLVTAKNMCHQNYKSSSRPQHRQKNGPNWAAGGPGMQAIFLESGRRSCGTGVFLPQRVETNFQSKNKPGTILNLFWISRCTFVLNMNTHLGDTLAFILSGFGEEIFFKTLFWFYIYFKDFDSYYLFWKLKI